MSFPRRCPSPLLPSRRALSVAVSVIAVGAVVLGCSEARKCREARREARWAVSSYLESLRPAVADLEERQETLRAALADEDAVVPEGDGATPAEELARIEGALPAWKARIDRVAKVLGELDGTGPVTGDPLAVFTERPDEVNPQAFKASRQALEAATNACGTE